MTAVPEPFPWDLVTAFCLGTLRIRPADFWRLSLKELAALLKPHLAAQPPTRAALEALMAAHPDGPPRDT